METDLGGSRNLPHIEGYQLLSAIGAGGQSVVYRAERAPPRSGTVALKVFRQSHLLLSPAANERFITEICIAKQLNHPNIVRALKSGSSGGLLYYEMKFVEGLRLDHYLAKRERSVQEVVKLFHKVCSAVGYAHRQGFIHRDLKPSNIMVTDAGEPQILDFGMGKALTQAASGDGPQGSNTVTGEFVGTFEWMSPEEAAGKGKDAGTPSDVYTLGVILFQVLTGGPRIR